MLKLTIFLTLICGAFSLNVSVYYESLCPDSRRFITSQLYPTYDLIPDYFNIEFVPFGHAKSSNYSDGSYSFTCQHGPNECYGNKIQACAIWVDYKKSIEFINCVMGSDNPSDDVCLQKCANASNILWDSIKKCINDGLGNKLLYEYGELTSLLNPEYVPTITFNGVYNSTLQDSGEHKFLATVCSLLEENKPTACEIVR